MTQPRNMSLNRGEETVDPVTGYTTIQSKGAARFVSNFGFRKGKVPFAEAVKYLKPEDIYNKMINSLIKDTNKNLLEGAPEEERILNRIAADVDVKYDDKEDTYSSYNRGFAEKSLCHQVFHGVNPG